MDAPPSLPKPAKPLQLEFAPQQQQQQQLLLNGSAPHGAGSSEQATGETTAGDGAAAGAAVVNGHGTAGVELPSGVQGQPLGMLLASTHANGNRHTHAHTHVHTHVHVNGNGVTSVDVGRSGRGKKGGRQEGRQRTPGLGAGGMEGDVEELFGADPPMQVCSRVCVCVCVWMGGWVGTALANTPRCRYMGRIQVVE